MTTPPVRSDATIAGLFEERFAPMVRLATLLTGSTETAEELVMDAFARLAPRYGEVEHPSAYLRTAVVNATRSHHRRLRTERQQTPHHDDTVEDPELDELWSRLEQLRPAERACVVLRFYEDLTIEQVASHLDLPAGTVKSHLHRAITTLRDLLGEEDR